MPDTFSSENTGGKGGNETQLENNNMLLPCPIRAGNPERYAAVLKRCKPGQMLKGNARVNEHLMRYHSRLFWCIDCKTNFATATKKNITTFKKTHKCCPKEWTLEEESTSHTWMTIEQEEEWSRWNTCAKRARFGNVVHEHYTKIWKIFNPESEIPNLDALSKQAHNGSISSPLGLQSGEKTSPLSADKKRKASAEPADERDTPITTLSGIGMLDNNVGKFGISPNRLQAQVSPSIQFMDPLSGDITIEELRRRPEAIEETHYKETTTGPGSMAFSSSSRSNEPNPRLPTTPTNQITNFANDLGFWIGDEVDRFPAYLENFDDEPDYSLGLNTFFPHCIDEPGQHDE